MRLNPSMWASSCQTENCEQPVPAAQLCPTHAYNGPISEARLM